MYDTHVFTGSRSGSTYEDASAVRTHPDDPSSIVCVVADGQGGHGGSAQAATLACERTIELAFKETAPALLQPARWLALLAQVDADIHAAPECGRTTVVAACIANGRVIGASSGDSAAYALTEHDVVDLTLNQKKNPPVGSSHAEFIPFGSTLAPPWSVALVTDGVWSHCGLDAYRHTLQSYRGGELRDALAKLAQKPGDAGCYHDTTILVVTPN